MQKITMIAVKNNSYLMRPDRIESVNIIYDLENRDNIVALNVYMINDHESCYHLNDPKDIKKIMSFITVLPDEDTPPPTTPETKPSTRPS